MKKKRCGKCQQILNSDQFHKYRRSPSGLQSYCKSCLRQAVVEHRQRNPDYDRNKDLKRQYGITLADYRKLQTQQNYQCKLYGRHQQDCASSLHVDHCHKTGRIRGLLCYNCNDGLGRFRDSPERLRRAARYLEGDA